MSDTTLHELWYNYHSYFPARPALRQHLSERSSLKPSVFLRGDTFHLNAKGHELVAEDLFLTLERAGLLP